MVDSLVTDVVLVLRGLYPKICFSILPKQLLATISSLILWQLFIAIHAYEYKTCKAITICLPYTRHNRELKIANSVYDWGCVVQPAISHYHSFFHGMLSFLMDTMISTWNLGWLVADSNHIFILSAEKRVEEWYRSVAAFTIVWRIGADSGVFSYTNRDAPGQTSRLSKSSSYSQHRWTSR